MAKLAIDIVLLPSEEVMKLAKDMNKTLDGQIDFVTGNCIPHITLCMGGVKKEDLPKVSKILEEISKELAPMDLTIVATEHYIGRSNSYKSTGLTIANTRALQKLHEKIMRRCKALLVKVSAADMHPSANTKASSAAHANGFAESDSFEIFAPHISIGIGAAKSIDARVNFTAKRLAVCHLGNWCTCREVLFETELRG